MYILYTVQMLAEGDSVQSDRSQPLRFDLKLSLSSCEVWHCDPSANVEDRSRFLDMFILIKLLT